jgi:hypothetical protein
MDPINYNSGVWRGMGLKMADYVIQPPVPTKRYSELVQEILQGDEAASSLALVLIDTEGFDCPIVSGIAKDNVLSLTHFLVFEETKVISKKAPEEHGIGYT